MLILTTVPLDESESTLLEETYQKYRDVMYSVAYSIVQNRADAEDIVQEVFLKLAKKYMGTLSRLARDDALLYYLLITARNTALSFIRSSAREVSVDPITLHNFQLTDDAFVSQLDSFDTSLLADKIRALPPIYQDVLYQRFVLDLSTREIAAMNHMPLSTVKKRLLRAKKQLRDLCKEEK